MFADESWHNAHFPSSPSDEDVIKFAEAIVSFTHYPSVANACTSVVVIVCEASGDPMWGLVFRVSRAREGEGAVGQSYAS